MCVGGWECMRACVFVCSCLHCVNETVTLLNLNFIYVSFIRD